MNNVKTTTRGNEKVKTKEKKKKKLGKGKDEKPDDLSDLMTKEDELLLQNVEDEDGECDIDFQEEGNDLKGSELSRFLKELEIVKYRPVYNDGSEKTKSETQTDKVDNGDEIQIKEEDDIPKVKKKKSDKIQPDIKEEVFDENDKVVDSKKKKKKKGQTAASEGTFSNGDGGDNVEVKEEKPDLKTLEAAMSYMKLQKNRSFLLLKSGELWREEKTYPMSKIGPEDKLVKEAEILAQKLLKDDIAHYTKQRENVKRSEARWLKTVLVSGTLSDKIAALTLLIQESPVHNVSSIENLISMAGKKGRREALMAVDTLKDLFMTGLLPDDRKLKFFYQFPLYSLWEMTSGNADQRDKLLLCWHFEDIIKKKYSQFIKILGEMLFDTLQATKEKAIGIIHQLLSGKPEQEHVLLPMMVNKIGDQNLNNKASHLMGKLVEEHPNMKGVIVKEICQLIYRPNVSQRAQYYAICFLTQLRLSKDESKLATDLIKVYLSFFQVNLKKREVDSKTMSALLTGVNRAYVYASEEKSVLLDQMSEVYKMLSNVNFQTGVQALMLLYHITDNDESAATRFYTALYRKLNDPGLASTTKHAVFLNLLFKSMKRDSADNRIMAFIKRVLQVYAHHPAHIICGVLILLSQVLTEKPELLKSAIKSRISWDKKNGEAADVIDDDDEEEKFVDLPIPEEFKEEEISSEGNEDKNDSVEPATSASKSSAKTSWIHRTNKDGHNERTIYDPNHRNPLYSKAEMECVWELEDLTRHFHPTVSLYASMLLKGESIKCDGDPLADYTLIRFLDRFVYKNPKKPIDQTNVGAPQVKAVARIRKIAVNSKEYLKQRKIPEDEQFYFKYFTEKERKRKEREDDEESIGDDEFDKYMDKFIDGRKEDFGDFDLDFAGETAKSKNKNKSQKGKKDESDSDDDDDDDDDELEDMDLGDDDLAAEFEKELQGLKGDESDDDGEGMSMRLGNENGFNEEDVEFSSDENDALSSMMMKPKKKGKKRDGDEEEDDDFYGLGENEGKKKKKKFDAANLFASAEQFSHLLEEGIDAGSVSLGGLDQMRNQDKAAQRQIAWEEKRDKWIQDKDNGRQFRGKKKPYGKSFGPGAGGGFKPKSKFGKKGKK